MIFYDCVGDITLGKNFIEIAEADRCCSAKVELWFGLDDIDPADQGAPSE